MLTRRNCVGSLTLVVFVTTGRVRLLLDVLHFDLQSCGFRGYERDYHLRVSKKWGGVLFFGCLLGPLVFETPTSETEVSRH